MFKDEALANLRGVGHSALLKLISIYPVGKDDDMETIRGVVIGVSKETLETLCDLEACTSLRGCLLLRQFAQLRIRTDFVFGFVV
jgi:hypothetical protein